LAPNVGQPFLKKIYNFQNVPLRERVVAKPKAYTAAGRLQKF